MIHSGGRYAYNKHVLPIGVLTGERVHAAVRNSIGGTAVFVGGAGHAAAGEIPKSKTLNSGPSVSCIFNQQEPLPPSSAFRENSSKKGREINQFLTRRSPQGLQLRSLGFWASVDTENKWKLFYLYPYLP